MANDLELIQSNLEKVAPRLTDVLAGRMPVGQLIGTILISFERNHRLFACSPQSVLNSAMTFAVLGLPVDGITGQGYIIPFKGQAQPMVGYKGYNTLAARAGVTITAGVVRDQDFFEYERGTNPYLRHKPVLCNPLEHRITAFWAAATSNERPPIFEIVTLDEVMGIKARSPAIKAGADTPWNDPVVGFPAMGEKSARRRLARSMPLALNHPEFHLAARIDEAFEERGKAGYLLPGGRLVLDGQPVYPEMNTNEPTAEDLTRDPADVRTALTEAAKHGTEALKLQWSSLTPREQHQLKALKDSLKSVAERYDEEKEVR